MNSNGWIKCSERMPDAHGFYLTYMEELDRFTVLLWTGKDDPSQPEAWNRAGLCADCITHWMPLPEKPKEEEQ